jgi:PIN domain nuclease of toxin-antitoxin system
VTASFLDTHAWIWLAAGDPRMVRHERALNRAAEARELFLSAISVYEAALIGIETDQRRRRGRQAVTMRPTVSQWIRDAIEGTRVVIIAPDGTVAMDAAALQGMHADPFDRFIVAGAIALRARLVTADTKIVAFARSAGLRLLEL